jgi:hypothetical protein
LSSPRSRWSGRGPISAPPSGALWWISGRVLTALAAALLITISWWKRRASDDVRLFVVRRTTSAVAGVAAVLLLLLVAFSTYSAIEPADALRGLVGLR